jgi:hypothetical protein
LEAVGERFDHTEGAAADASGRSQNCNALHGFKYVTGEQLLALSFWLLSFFAKTRPA